MTKQSDEENDNGTSRELTPGVDYYINENGFFVFTASYLLRRGYCCQNGCLHCPYGFKKPGKDNQ